MQNSPDLSFLYKIKGRVIAMDLDDTLYPTLIHIDNFAKLFKQVKTTGLEHYTTYSFGNVWGVTSEEVNFILDRFFESNYSQMIEPFSYAKIMCQILSENNKLIIATSRRKNIEQITKDKIRKDFGEETFKPENIYVTGEAGSNKPEITKKDIVLEHRADYFFEDYHKYIFDIIKNGFTKAIMFPRLLNKHVKEQENLKIAENFWYSVPQILKAYERLIKQK